MSVKRDVQLVLIAWEVMRKEVSAEVPLVAHYVLEYHRLQNARAWRNRFSPPGERHAVIENGLGYLSEFPVSPTDGQGDRWGQQAEEICPRRIDPDILQPHQEIDGLVLEELRLADIRRENQLLCSTTGGD